MKYKIGMGSHQSARMNSDEWLTPPWVLKSLGESGIRVEGVGDRVAIEKKKAKVKRMMDYSIVR